MLGRTYDDEACSIARTLEVVGERWSLLIVRNAMFAGHTRYGEFQQSLGIASNVLSSRLDALVTAGVLERREAPGRPELPEYLLTDKGWELQPALVALTQWGDKWAAPAGPPVRYRHSSCGGAVTTATSCNRCGAVEPRTVQAHPGPGMPPDRAARMRARLVRSRRELDPAIKARVSRRKA